MLGSALGKTPSTQTMRKTGSTAAFTSPPVTDSNDDDFFAQLDNTRGASKKSELCLPLLSPKLTNSFTYRALSEDEQLQLALAISASEADASKPNGNSSSPNSARQGELSSSEPSTDAFGAFTQSMDFLDMGDLASAQKTLKLAIQTLGSGT